jgi:hypothetical protein
MFSYVRYATVACCINFVICKQLCCYVKANQVRATEEKGTENSGRLRQGQCSLRGLQRQRSPSRRQPKQTSSDRPEERASEQTAIATKGMSVRAPGTHGTSPDTMFRVATVVRQIMTKMNDATSEEEKTVTITKIVIKLKDVNGH